MSTLPIRTRDEILAVSDIKEETIAVPEWDTTLKLRGLTLGEINHITNFATRKDGKLDNLRMNALMFVRGVVEPKFTDQDAEALAGKSAGVILRVAVKISELSGVSVEALASALKNSESGPSDDSS